MLGAGLVAQGGWLLGAGRGARSLRPARGTMCVCGLHEHPRTRMSPSPALQGIGAYGFDPLLSPPPARRAGGCLPASSNATGQMVCAFWGAQPFNLSFCTDQPTIPWCVRWGVPGGAAGAAGSGRRSPAACLLGAAARVDSCAAAAKSPALLASLLARQPAGRPAPTRGSPSPPPCRFDCSVPWPWPETALMPPGPP